MKKKYLVWKALLLVLGPILAMASTVSANPADWSAPWDAGFLMQVGPRNPNSSEYHATGENWYEPKGEVKFAIDFLPCPREKENVPIYAPVDGKIIESKGDWKTNNSGDHGGYGNFVLIEADGETIILAHLDRLNGTLGQNVKRGDLLGYMGKTGSGGNNVIHLHFEILTEIKSADISLFGQKASVFIKDRMVDGGIQPQSGGEAISLGGNYVGTEGYFDDKENKQSLPWVNGGLSVNVNIRGDLKDALSVETNGTNGYINFQEDTWLYLGWKEIVFQKKQVGKSSSGKELREWNTVTTDFIYYHPHPTQVYASYVLTQINDNTLRLTVEHMYGKNVVTLQKSSGSLSSAYSKTSMFSVPDSGADERNTSASGGVPSYSN